MPWGKNKPYSFSESSSKDKKNTVQGTSYTKKPDSPSKADKCE